jgi:polar amino acid transport system substrate-binding protein
MKKGNLFVLVMFMLVLILGACTPAAVATSTAEPTKVVVADTATVAAPTPASTPANVVRGCLGSADTAIVDLKCQKLTIAIENAYPPFNYINITTGIGEGWDYDAWDEICRRLHCEPSYVEASWEGLIQAVSDKQYDAAADGITITDDRLKIVDFSTGYVRIEQRLLVRKGETRFKSIEELKANEKLVIGTQTGTTNYETAASILPESRIKAFEQFPFAVQALIAGDIDAVIIDETAGQGYLGENSDKVELIGPAIVSQELGFVFAKGSALVDPVNKALKAMIDDGFLNTLNTKYFGPNFKAPVE